MPRAAAPETWTATVVDERLANGLRVILAPRPDLDVVSTVLVYGVGARDEAPGAAGAAHFLEHMMFRGSPGFGPGEVDRRTQDLGGVNNAFTSHDATAYHFQLAADRWHEALVMEADRMAAIDLEPALVEVERRVILDEIAMVASDPWDALEDAVLARRYPGHPYGRPVLGWEESVREIDGATLRALHAERYAPDNAVLVAVGGLGAGALEAVARTCGAVPARPPRGREAAPAAPDLLLPERLERRCGDVPRLLVAFPSPPADAPEAAPLLLLATLLAGGRTSRLHHRLVEEEDLCLWVNADAPEQAGPGTFAVAAELHEDADPARVEAVVAEELRRLATEPVAEAELARVRRILLADWWWALETTHHQAVTLGLAAVLWDVGQPARALAAACSSPPEGLQAVAARYLDPAAGSVWGWSLPEEPGNGRGR